MGLRDHQTPGPRPWNQKLGQVKVEGGTPAQRRVFYTALYHCYERMVNISEDGQYYSGFDHKVHQDRARFYVDNWLWDTYRALEPLHMLLNPEQEADKIQSYVRMYKQSGWMPSFALVWGDWHAMTGNHSAAWMADAWFKGIRNFDLKTGYEGVRKNALESTMLPWRKAPKCPLDDFYAEHGYYPALHPGRKGNRAPSWIPTGKAASRLPYAGPKLRRLVHRPTRPRTGQQRGLRLLLKAGGELQECLSRGQRASCGRRTPKGEWIEPFDPKWTGGRGRDYFTENNAYTFHLDVQQDYDGLFELMGGRQRRRSQAGPISSARTWAGPRFEFYSQVSWIRPEWLASSPWATSPAWPIPYIYNHLGAPWKTQKRVRQLLESMVHGRVHGHPRRRGRRRVCPRSWCSR